MAKTADASMSKFSEKLSDEAKTTRGLGKKRKVCLFFKEFFQIRDLIIIFFIRIVFSSNRTLIA